MCLFVPSKLAIDPKTFTLKLALVCSTVRRGKPSWDKDENGKDEDETQCIRVSWESWFLSKRGQLQRKRGFPSRRNRLVGSGDYNQPIDLFSASLGFRWRRHAETSAHVPLFSALLSIGWPVATLARDRSRRRSFDPRMETKNESGFIDAGRMGPITIPGSFSAQDVFRTRNDFPMHFPFGYTHTSSSFLIP